MPAGESREPAPCCRSASARALNPAVAASPVAAATTAMSGASASPTAGPLAGPATDTVDMTPAWLAGQGSRSVLAGREQHGLRPGNEREHARHGVYPRRQQQHAEPERLHGDLRQRRADHGRQRPVSRGERHERAGVDLSGTNATLAPQHFYLPPLPTWKRVRSCSSRISPERRPLPPIRSPSPRPISNTRPPSRPTQSTAAPCRWR